MASQSPGLGSARFPLWQGVISWPPSSPGGMTRDQHLELRALSATSPRCPQRWDLRALPAVGSCPAAPGYQTKLRQAGVQRGCLAPSIPLCFSLLGDFVGFPLQTKPPTASWGQAKQGEDAPAPAKAACAALLCLFANEEPVSAPIGLTQPVQAEPAADGGRGPPKSSLGSPQSSLPGYRKHQPVHHCPCL